MFVFVYLYDKIVQNWFFLRGLCCIRVLFLNQRVDLKLVLNVVVVGVIEYVVEKNLLIGGDDFKSG